jgi:hypothetical protein
VLPGGREAPVTARVQAKPVTTFKRSNTLYRQNSHLDRDKDGIACEKA